MAVKNTEYQIPSTRSIHDMPSRQRPRELFDRVGAENVPDEVLLAIVLRSGVKGTNVIELARALLEEYGSLTGMAQVTPDELARIKGMGKVKAQVLKAALEVAKRLSEESNESPMISTPMEAATLLRERARSSEGEVFWVLPLDTRNRLKRSPVEVTKGLLDASLVHPREVFREAIRSSCAAIVLAHNHPSGDPTPSSEDIRITRQLVEAGRIIDINVLDHVVIGRQTNGEELDFFSLREAGLVNFEGR